MGLFRRNMTHKVIKPINNYNDLYLSSEEIACLRVKRNTIQFHLIEGRAWIT